jgi:uncharacterized membrane protein YphA (DoxX/SURF4 family)
MEGTQRSGGAVKRFLANDYVLLLVRILVGIVFIVASHDKLFAPEVFANSISNYRLVSGTIAMIAATWLPWVELLAGLGILLGPFYKGSALLLSTLMIVFTLAVLSGLVRGLDISCGCFTQDPNSARIGWMKLIENIALTVAAFVAARFGPGRLAISRRSR